MVAERALEQGRGAYATRAWADAFEALSRANREKPLEPEDLEPLAHSAYMLGLDDAYRGALEQASAEAVPLPAPSSSSARSPARRGRRAGASHEHARPGRVRPDRRRLRNRGRGTAADTQKELHWVVETGRDRHDRPRGNRRNCRRRSAPNPPASRCSSSSRSPGRASSTNQLRLEYARNSWPASDVVGACGSSSSPCASPGRRPWRLCERTHRGQGR